MTTRRWAGLGVAAAGLLLLAIGLARAISAGNDDSASPAASQVGSHAPQSESSEPSARITGVPTSPALGEADVRDFAATLVAAIQAGDADTLIADLHPAVLERYDEATCRAQLALADPTFGIEIVSVAPQAAWDYVTDGLTTSIPDAWAVQGNRSHDGTAIPTTFHFAPAGGRVRWFTDCTP